jgi:protein-disulfide isomerase
MNVLSGWQRFSFQWVLRSIGLVLLCMALNSCSIPTQAGSSQPTNAELQAKVLQIIRDHPEVILESVQAYQQKQQEQQQQAQKAFSESMRANPKSVIGDSPTTGASEQKIVLMEFSDFQCPYCAKAHQTLKQFMARHQGQVTLVYKHLPLTAIHPQAMPAAKAAWAAGQQGKFWEFHDALFTQQDKLGEPLYVATAKALNLDLKRFDQDRNSNAASAAIQKDVEMAEKLGVNGTPFVVMNGVPISGAAEIAELEALLAQVSKP